MPELTADELTSFTTAFEPLCDQFATLFADKLGQAKVGPASLMQHAVEDVTASTDTFFQVAFTLPELGGDPWIIVLPDEAAPIVADLLGGGEGTETGTLADEAEMTKAKAAFSEVATTLAAVLGTGLGLPLAPAGVEASVGTLQFPQNVVDGGHVIKVAMPLQAGAVVDTVVSMFLTPQAAQAVAGTSAPAETAETDETDVEPTAAPTPISGMAPPPPGAAAFQPFESFGGAPETMPRGIELIADIPLQVTVELGRVQMLIKDVLELATGSIVELERVAGEPVDLMVNGQLIAKGEVVVIEDNFGIRITEIVSPADRLQGVGRKL